MTATKIEWATDTLNPIRARDTHTGRVGWACTHVSEGCRNCYAEGFNRRLGTGLPYLPTHLSSGRVQLFLEPKALAQVARWRKPRRVFLCSMTDLFADFIPDPWRDQIMGTIVQHPQHQFMILTKRPDVMAAYFAGHPWKEGLGRRLRNIASWAIGGEQAEDGDWITWPLPNLIVGTSAEDQATYNARILHLFRSPAAAWFLSAEPLIGEIRTRECDLTGAADFAKAEGPRLHWVIVGGESGPKARPMHPDWARSLRDQCASTSTPFFLKQNGVWQEHYPSVQGDLRADLESGRVVRLPSYRPDSTDFMRRVGKDKAGRLLDGIEHNTLPQLPAV